MDEQDRRIRALIRESKEADERYGRLKRRIAEHAEELANLSGVLRQSPKDIKFLANCNDRGLAHVSAIKVYEDSLSIDAIKETLQDLEEATKQKAAFDKRKQEEVII